MLSGVCVELCYCVESFYFKLKTLSDLCRACLLVTIQPSCGHALISPVLKVVLQHIENYLTLFFSFSSVSVLPAAVRPPWFLEASHASTASRTPACGKVSHCVPCCSRDSRSWFGFGRLATVRFAVEFILPGVRCASWVCRWMLFISVALSCLLARLMVCCLKWTF